MNKRGQEWLRRMTSEGTGQIAWVHHVRATRQAKEEQRHRPMTSAPSTAPLSRLSPRSPRGSLPRVPGVALPPAAARPH